MEAHLLGRLTCPPIDEHSDLSSDLIISTVTSLLYFDRVYVATYLAPLQPGDRNYRAADEAAGRLFERAADHGESSVIFDWKNPPKGTCCRDALWLSYAPWKEDHNASLQQ